MTERDKQIVKTYLITDTFETDFPPEFVNARGKKYIVVRYCAAEVGDEYMPYDLCLHADFITRDYYLDHFVDVCNIIDTGSKPSKYEYPENGKKSFKVWFCDMKGNRIDDIIPIDFILKLLLIYEV